MNGIAGLRAQWSLTLDEKLIELLLADKTTGQNLRWATDSKGESTSIHTAADFLTAACLDPGSECFLRSRVEKTTDEQAVRTKDLAEVFTPAWVVNEQNNLVDDAWLGTAHAFNTPVLRGWKTTDGAVSFPERRDWHDYVDKCVMEVSCGEAPYLTSRYDATTGEVIDARDRVGLLDRKLRVLNENAVDNDEWSIWALRAYRATYAYDLQGDNVLIARENLLATFDEQAATRGIENKLLRQKVANTIAWNVFQMDGLTYESPFSTRSKAQQGLFTLLGEDEAQEPVPCRIYDWKARRSMYFRDLIRG